MNPNLLLGGIVFLLWSTFSSWYYVCQIKDLCVETSSLVQEQIPEVVLEERPVTEPVESDSVPQQPEQPALSAISIEENKISFVKNTTVFVDADYAERFADQLRADLQGRDVEIKIVGHTCDLGAESYNLNLGKDRAQAMQTYLESKGIRPSSFQTSSKGESEATGEVEAQRIRDRKVSITIKSIDQ